MCYITAQRFDSPATEDKFMQKVLGPVLIIIGLIVMYYMFPSLMVSINQVRSDDFPYSFYSVATAGGVTNATVVLPNGKSLYQSDIGNIETVTSDNVADHPTVQNYAAAGTVLSVQGLAAGSSRNLTVTYLTPALTGYSGLDQFTGITPLLLMIGGLFVIIGGVWASIANHNR